MEPKDKSTDEWKTRDATNSLVAAWLLNSMSPIIARSVDTIATASGIWTVLSKMFWNRECNVVGRKMIESIISGKGSFL